MDAPASPGNHAALADDAVFMDRALELAARGVALSSPNPMVGAILVRDGRIMAEGFHTYDGVRHAEVIALEQARERSLESLASLAEDLAESLAEGVAAGLAVAPGPTTAAGPTKDPAGRFVGRAFRHDNQAGISPGVLTPEGARDAARGATLYINLEPCCHTGRTGPCTQVLIAAGVARVVAAMADPNPAVSGRGFKQLRDAGIEVSTGLREAEARRLNEPFARWIISGNPLVTLKSALTLDGQLVLPHPRGRTRPPLKDHWISSPAARAEVQRMRHASDALLTGVGTVLVDDPLLTDRTGLPRRRKLLRVVMDSQLRLPLRSKLVRSVDHDVLVFTRAREDSLKARALRRAGVEVVRLAGRTAKPDLRAVIAELGRREILSVLLESGAALNSAALAAGIVDKMRVFIAPKIAGISVGSTVPPGFRAAQELQNVTMQRFGTDFAIEGYLRDVYRTR